MSFEVRVVECPARRPVGMKVRTDLQRAQEDAMALWDRFGPRMAEVDGDARECFGVCAMIDENNWDYWAALETVPGAPLPEGMGAVEIPGGLYACCTLTDIAKVLEAYVYLADAWLRTHPEYTADPMAIAFERYPTDYKPGSPFEVCMYVTPA